MATTADEFARTQRILEKAGIDVNKYNEAIANGASKTEAMKAGGWNGAYSTQNSSNTVSTNPNVDADGYTSATQRNMATNGAEFGGLNQTSTPTVEKPTNQKVETPTKQGETIGSTVPEIQQQGELKPLSQEYYNQANDNALNIIKNNLNSYKQSNPELFTNYDTFKRNFSYDARNEEQKNLLDDWYKGYQQGLELSTTPTTDLYTEYQGGQISSAELENLRISNPTKYAELQAQINKGNIISAYDDDKSTADDMFTQLRNTWMQNMITNLTTAGSGASNIFAGYEGKMNSPEMMEIQDKTTELEEQIENLNDDRASIKKAVEKEYEGTGASRSKINAIIADRCYDLDLQLRTLNSEYNKYATQYNNRMNQYQSEFQLELQEYQVNQQARQQQMSELGFAMDLMSFETPQQEQEREWNYRVKQQEYQNGDINSKDYSTRYKAALKGVENLLSQYEGIPMQRSSEQMAQDVLKAIDNGSTLGEELTKINKQIQSKPEYKQIYNATFGNATQGFGNSISIGGMDYVEYNGKLYTADQFNQEFGGVTKPANYTVVSEDVLKTYSEGREGTFGSFMAKSANNDGNYIGQCGKFVNNYLQEIGAGRPFGNEDITTREGWVNSDEGKVGTVALFDYNHYIDGKNYGHVGIVVSRPDKNGDFWVKDANYSSDGKIQTRKVNLKDASLKGFIDPSLPQNGVSVVSVGGTEGDIISAPTTTVGNLTPTQFDEYVKQYINGEVSYTEVKAAYGDDGLATVTERAAQIKEGGYEKSKQITDPSKILTAERDYMSKFNSMNKETTTALQRTSKMNDALNAISEDKKNDKKILNGASQVIVSAFNKLMDPDSVIRESEYARTPEGQSLIDQMEGKIEQISKGGAGLTYDNLKGLVDLANTLSSNYKNQQNELALLIKNNADTYGLNINNILPISVIQELESSQMELQTQQTQQAQSEFDQIVNSVSPNKGRRWKYGINQISLTNGESFER